MPGITRLIRNHAAPAYFALTFAISWTGVLLFVGGSGFMSAASPTGDPRFVYAVIAMLAGPSISGVLLTAVIHGRKGLRAYLRRAATWRVPARWYAVALLAAPLLWLATLAALSLGSPRFLPGILSSDGKPALLLVGVAVALSAGLLEELGWTGFAIPHLRQHQSVLATGLIVGVAWAAWHLLTNVFWGSRASAGELPLAIFLPASVAGLLTGYLVAFRVLMVWVYERTESTLLAMTMHASLTASVLVLDPAGLAGASLLFYSFTLAIVVWAAVVAIAARNGWLAPGSQRRARLAA